MTTLAYTEIPPEKMSRADGFLNAIIPLSMGLGVTMGANTLRLVAHAHGHSAAMPQLRDSTWRYICIAVLCASARLR